MKFFCTKLAFFASFVQNMNMATLIEQKLKNTPEICLTDSDLTAILQVNNQQRYSLIKRALKNGNLVRVRRGLYCLGKNLTQEKPHPFALAEKIYWPSYISFESALAHYGLIPEAVYNITCATSKRAANFTTPYGNFSYIKMPTVNFFAQVEKVIEGKAQFFIAKPWRAICDYMYYHKRNWIDLQPLFADLRIEQDDLPKITLAELTELENYYHNKRVSLFINYLKKNVVT
jgi:predicted transcriptional regulator of viral defense system